MPATIPPIGRASLTQLCALARARGVARCGHEADDPRSRYGPRPSCRRHAHRPHPRGGRHRAGRPSHQRRRPGRQAAAGGPRGGGQGLRAHLSCRRLFPQHWRAAAGARLPSMSCRCASAWPRTSHYHVPLLVSPFMLIPPIGGAEHERDAIRFLRRGRVVTCATSQPTHDAARLAAPERALDRHQGRLRRGRLRRLHGGARAAARRRGSSMSRSMPASCSSARRTARR